MAGYSVAGLCTNSCRNAATHRDATLDGGLQLGKGIANAASQLLQPSVLRSSLLLFISKPLLDSLGSLQAARDTC